MSDLEHTNEFGEIEAFKDTKYWFKKDLLTIKKALKKVFKISPLIFLIALIFSSSITFLYNGSLNFFLIFIYLLILFPVFLLAYMMLYVMINKGYEIDAYEGTYIDTPKHDDRFSLDYLLTAKMSKKRKAIHIVRLAIYSFMTFGLVFYIIIMLIKEITKYFTN